MIVFEHTLPALFIWMGLAAAVVVSVLSFWRFMPRRPSSFVMLFLRLLFLGVLVWCCFLPGMKKILTEMLKPRFIVAVDTSSSMQLAPREDVSNRWATVTRVLQQPWTQTVAAECELDVYTFDREVSPKLPLPALETVRPEGATTLLRDALKRIAARYAGLNVTGCLLLSDGIDTREALDDWATAARPFPVYTALLEPRGGWEEEPDVRVDTVSTPRRVTVGWTTELKAVISGQGTKGEPLTVQLRRDGILVQERPARIPVGSGASDVRFELTHPEVGVFTYRVSVPPLAGESHTNDNQYAASVQVITSRNHVLYVEGPPRWESKYLSRALQANPEMEPLVFLRGPGGKFMTLGRRGSMTPDMDPSQLAFFKIVVVGNLSAEAFGTDRARNLVQFVESGGSLILLGGKEAWGAGGFARGPLKQVLPVRGPAQPLVEGRFAVALTDAGRAHPAFGGDTEFWETIPPVLSVFPGAVLSAGAQALVAARTPAGPQPIIVTHRYGQGKVAALFTDSLWKWQLNPDAAEHRPYQRFWDQLIAWMTPEEEDVEQQRLDMFADREQLFLGEEIELSAAWTGGESDAAPAGVQCDVTLPTERVLPLAVDEQRVVTASGKSFPGYVCTFKADTPGLHKVVARGAIGGQDVTSDPISFFVKPFTPESVPRPSNINVLRAIADHSGGRYFADADELNEALSVLRFAGIEEEISEYMSLWQHVAVISLLVLLPALAWSLRKWRNMP